jgi:hypothetical protein
MKTNMRLSGYIIIIAATLFTACDDLLDKKALTQLESSDFWKTDADAQAALAATYSAYRTNILGSGRGANGVSFDIEAMSDNAITTAGFVNYNNILQGGIGPTTAGAISQMWTDCYNGISKCNYFLDNVEKAKDVLTADNYTKYKAEALFNRCYFYNELIQLYGAVPLVLESQDLARAMASKTIPRTPKVEVVEQLLSDLDVAIAGLPMSTVSTSPVPAYTNGHAVKGSAIMLKTRILMNNQRYAEAAATAWTLIQHPPGTAENPFKLHSSYQELFFKGQKNNPEIMFSVMYSAPDDYHQLDQYVGSRMSCFPTPQLRDSYTVNTVTGQMDPRRKMTIFEEGDPWVNNPVTHTFTQSGSRAEGTIPFTKMAFKKWIDTTIFVANSSNLSDQHIVKMRYADLLLMYAEAMFESGQGTAQSAIDALNAVRARPGVEMPPVAVLTQDIIRNERRVELAYEGLRYNDLIRWGIAETVIPTIVYAANGNKRKFDGYLWPIPQSQMDIMQGVWTNNAPW